MKKIAFLTIFFLLLIVSTVNALGLYDLEPGTLGSNRDIRIMANDDGSFYGLSYIISSTGATSGIRYRTSAITVNVNGKMATIDISHLVGSGTPGQTTYSQIAVSKEDIIKSLGEQHRAEVESMKPEKINIGANIQIYNAATGQVLTTIKNESDVSSVAGRFGFGSQDINDMKSRFQQNIYIDTVPYEDPYDPGDEEEYDDNLDKWRRSHPEWFIDPDGSGLRPSVLIR